MTYEESERYEGYKNGKSVPVSGYRYKGSKHNSEYNDVFYKVEYHVDTLVTRSFHKCNTKLRLVEL